MKRITKKIALTPVLAVLIAALLCGCGEKAAPKKDVDLGGVLASFALPGEGMLKLTQDDLLDMYGIQAGDVKQFAAVIASSGVQADEIVLIESPDSAAAGRVREALDRRYQAKLNETDNYLPDEYAVIKTCSVRQDGLFTAMIVSPDADSLTALYDKAVK